MERVLNQYEELYSSLGAKQPGDTLCKEIRQTIREVIESIPANARLGIRACGVHTETLLEEFDFSKKNVIGIFDRQKIDDTYCGYACFPAEKISELNCDYMLISSYVFRHEIYAELQDLQIQVIDLYLELEKRGIKLRRPFYDYEPGFPMTLNYFYLRYLESRGTPYYEETLTEVLQAAIECKDFVMVGRIYEENGGEHGKYPVLLQTWHRVKNLLSSIHQLIKARQQNDIIVFWTDAISFDQMMGYMPDTKARAARGCAFHRVYTHTPYTNPTLRAMFRGLLPIDDFTETQTKINRENSALIQYLEGNGYDIKVITDAGRAIDSHYAIRTRRNVSCHEKWWKGLLSLLAAEKPCFYVFHFLIESHIPTLTPDLQHFVNDIYKKSAARESQTKRALAYLDQCLSMFSWLLGDTTQVFLSDHGDSLQGGHHWLDERIHAYCFAVGKGIQPQVISRFFQYRCFTQFVQWLLEPNRYLLEDICTDYAVFQDTDFYDPYRVSLFIRRGVPKEAIAYRGVIDYSYKYAINSLGEEFFYIYTQTVSEEPAVLEDETLRRELRKKCGENFLDIDKIDKFRHSKKLYESIRRNEENG